jgi:hypothetical protein
MNKVYPITNNQEIAEHRFWKYYFDKNQFLEKLALPNFVTTKFILSLEK